MKGWMVILLFFWAGFGCHRDQKAIVFSFKYQPGEVYTYQIYDDVTSTHLSGQENNRNYYRLQEQRSVMKVLDKDSTGVFKLTLSFTVVHDSLWQIENGKAVTRQPRRGVKGKNFKYTLHMRENGEIVDVAGRDESSTFFYERAYKTSQPVFPQQKIAPGYSWKQTVAVNMPDAEPFTAVTKYTFSGFETVDDYECAVINFTAHLEIKADLTRSKWNKKHYQKWYYQNITTSTGKIYFDYVRGAMVRKETTISINRKSDYVDRDGKAIKDYRQIVDKERIKLICVHQDSNFPAIK